MACQVLPPHNALKDSNALLLSWQGCFATGRARVVARGARLSHGERESERKREREAPAAAPAAIDGRGGRGRAGG
jgi:hypothetical protein